MIRCNSSHPQLCHCRDFIPQLILGINLNGILPTCNARDFHSTLKDYYAPPSQKKIKEKRKTPNTRFNTLRFEAFNIFAQSKLHEDFLQLGLT